jgi:hypothetical protein
MNERVVATRQRVSNPDWLVPNGAENRLQIDFEIDLEIDAKSTPIPILNYPIGYSSHDPENPRCLQIFHGFYQTVYRRLVSLIVLQVWSPDYFTSLARQRQLQNSRVL